MYWTKKRLKTELYDFINEQEVDYFITVNFNNNINMLGARRLLRYWHARIDSKLLGKNWSKESKENRLFFIAFPEHLSSNLHWHMVVRLADPNKKKIIRIYC